MLWRLLFCLLVTMTAANAQSLRLDQFPPAVALSDTDITFVEQGGVLPAKQVPLSTLKNYLLGTPLASTGTSASASGSMVRLDQLGQAATLSDTDLLLLQPPSPQAAPCCAITLAALKAYFVTGDRLISSGGASVDASFASGSPPFVRLNPTLGGTAQQWLFDGQHFSNVALLTLLGNATGPYLADNGDGTVTATPISNPNARWIVVPSGSGFTIQNAGTSFYLMNVNGVLGMSGGQQIITSLLLSGGTTGSFSPSPPANTSVGPLTETCSPSGCAGVVASLSTTAGTCTPVLGSGNNSFLVTSPDGTTISAGSGNLQAIEGIWSFGAISTDGVDYSLLLNGAAPPAGGLAGTMEIVNGNLYLLNQSTGTWYLRTAAHTYMNIGTTAPTEGASPVPQALIVLANTVAGTYPVCAVASGPGFSPTSAALSITSTPVGPTITSVLLNGGRTGSFTAPTTTRVTLGPITPTCSNGACVGITTSLSTTADGCTPTNGAGNGNFYMTSVDGSAVTAPSAASLLTTEGTWTFGGLTSGSTTDYDIQLNGVPPPGGGSGALMTIVNGSLYAMNKGNGNWYVRTNGAWPVFGTTAPVETASRTPQTLVTNLGVAAGTYPVCVISTG